jgi:hypothetical protein
MVNTTYFLPNMLPSTPMLLITKIIHASIGKSCLKSAHHTTPGSQPSVANAGDFITILIAFCNMKNSW